MPMSRLAVERVAARYLIYKYAGPLTDVSKLRYQAVFMMGAGGSGKGYVGYKWMKYMPGGGMDGAGRKKFDALVDEKMSEAERSLTNIRFEKAKDALEEIGLTVDVRGATPRIPFRLFDSDGRLIKPSEWEDTLPPQVYRDVRGLQEIVFSAPKAELPTYWRQVNPDLYKQELAGYMESQPGYVHQMSSEMARTYFQAILDSGDPLFVDGTGRSYHKIASQIEAAKKAGYKVSLVLVVVPLTVNLIRNAVRARKVSADKIIGMWKQVTDNFPKLRGDVDRSKVVINRNDSADVKSYVAQRAEVDAQVSAPFPQYNGLQDVVRHYASNEYKEWGKKLGWF